ncbi:hypothetical protein [Streptomyces sp. NPDC020747]|uniref:hypothetical protein n=1 Tax=Streptomyces sp. NPDC020747 TaxID=3365086 RepID=UPI00379BFF44
MSGIGPVEPTDTADFTGPTGPTGPIGTARVHQADDVIGDNSPHLYGRLSALPPRIRRTVLAAATAGALAAAILLTPSPLGTSPPPPPDEPSLAPFLPPPTPFPANVTTFAYTGTANTDDPDATSDSFHFTVSVRDGPPVTLHITSAAYPGLHAHTAPDAPFTVRAGTTHRITVRIAVTECSGLPLNASLPFLDVTLRNTRAIQHHSFIFGGAYPRDLSRLLHTACDPV